MRNKCSVTVVVGDIFESPAQTLTNTINTVGIMGKGIARGFRARFPDMYDDYVIRCRNGEVRLGEPYLYRGMIGPWILNFPTKEHWRSASRLDAIRSGLVYLAERYEPWGVESLAVPALGCGEGGLEWRIVGPTLYRGLSALDIPVTLYGPFGTSPQELQPGFLELDTGSSTPSRITASQIALAEIIDRITAARYHYAVGRTSFQKICYFATVVGIPTGLQFEKRPYGPFTPEGRKLQAHLVNKGLISENRRGRMFVLTPGPTLHDTRRMVYGDLGRWESRIEKVVDLFLRLSTTAAAELASTVHYVTDLLASQHQHRGGVTTAEEVVVQVERWKAGRTPPYAYYQIVGMVRTLDYLGWIDVLVEEDDLALV